jgi:hypothetical protein
MKKVLYLQTGQQVTVDEEDFMRCFSHNWRLDPKGYVCTSIDGGASYLFLHNFLLNLPNGSGIDHIDRNKLNNSKSNLRLATNSQQGANRNIFKNNTSGYKGVTIKKTSTGRLRYAARIKVNYENINLGNYDTAEEAAKAYDVAALQYFGEFACLNFSVESKGGSLP